MRSYLQGRRVTGGRPGSISACAELPLPLRDRSHLPGVYLRVCGVTTMQPFKKQLTTGLSPRVRSYRKRKNHGVILRGSISACAELPPPEPDRESVPTPSKVYLRVCGVTASTSTEGATVAGLSPRVRSYRRLRNVLDAAGGSISACAELPPRARRESRGLRVYLRVCGVILFFAALNERHQGLSPRVRSYPREPAERVEDFGSISACAELSA